MLDHMAKRFNTPRDALVEYSILKLLPVIRQEQEKHENRKALLREIRSNLKDGLKILKKTAAELGEEDPVHTKLEAAMSAYTSSHQAIEAFVERCKIIEDFDPDVLESFLNKAVDSAL